MGSDAKKAFNAVGRDELLWFEPETLTIVEDETSALADPDRLAKPPPEWLVQSIITDGNDVPIIVRLNGKHDDGTPRVEVVDGRQRVRAAREANVRLARLGQEPVRVKGVRTRGEDHALLGMMIRTNELRQDDSPLAKARKAARYLKMGRSYAETAAQFGVKEVTVKQWESLLDCAPDVQKAVERGELPATTAATLSKLPREEQSTKLEEMRAAGTMRGAAGVAAAEKATSRASNGHAPADAEPVATLPSRVWLKRLLAELEAVLADSDHPHYGSDEGKVAVAVLKLVLEGKKPRGNVVATAWREVNKRFSRGRSNGAEAEA